MVSIKYLGELNDSKLTEVMDILDNVVDKCIRVRGGISSQYFYRSLYAIQLHHCFKVRHPHHK